MKVIQSLSWSEIKISYSWSTPDEYVEAARECFGGEIDLDPATNELFQKRIKAKRYYTRDTNGLVQRWDGTVWLNAPYIQPQLSSFISKAVDEWKSNRITEMLIMTHTSETWAEWFQSALSISSAILIIRGRVKWVPAWDDQKDRIKEAGIDESCFPTYSVHGSCIIYCGSDPNKFGRIFKKFGSVWRICEEQSPSI